MWIANSYSFCTSLERGCGGTRAWQSYRGFGTVVGLCEDCCARWVRIVCIVSSRRQSLPSTTYPIRAGGFPLFLFFSLLLFSSLPRRTPPGLLVCSTNRPVHGVASMEPRSTVKAALNMAVEAQTEQKRRRDAKLPRWFVGMILSRGLPAVEASSELKRSE